MSEFGQQLNQEYAEYKALRNSGALPTSNEGSWLNPHPTSDRFAAEHLIDREPINATTIYDAALAETGS